jgi:hypothetical protein
VAAQTFRVSPGVELTWPPTPHAAICVHTAHACIAAPVRCTDDLILHCAKLFRVRCRSPLVPRTSVGCTARATYSTVCWRVALPVTQGVFLVRSTFIVAAWALKLSGVTLPLPGLQSIAGALATGATKRPGQPRQRLVMGYIMCQHVYETHPPCAIRMPAVPRILRGGAGRLASSRFRGPSTQREWPHVCGSAYPGYRISRAAGCVTLCQASIKASPDDRSAELPLPPRTIALRETGQVGIPRLSRSGDIVLCHLSRLQQQRRRCCSRR